MTFLTASEAGTPPKTFLLFRQILPIRLDKAREHIRVASLAEIEFFAGRATISPCQPRLSGAFAVSRSIWPFETRMQANGEGKA